MLYGDFVSKFFSLDSILFALFAILTLFQGLLNSLSRYFFNSSFKNFLFRTFSKSRSQNCLYRERVIISM
ncbi:hypothetical protein [Leptospira kirschneri]|uniref:hypothetical protein n=1 Tax=Leptospira kirschneri TaxID=29507 RepID=UPI0009CC42DC|nr:hypothetical protein B1J94_19340 [Leptospira kirschneri serovar Grippotyphosa]